MATLTERLDALEPRVAALEAAIINLLATPLQGPPGNDGPPGPQGPAGQDYSEDIARMRDQIAALQALVNPQQ